jgi:AraC family transcriptional regulator, glycine betaine-responsive activator
MFETKTAISTIFAPAAAEPLDIDVLALPDVSLLSLASTIEPLRGANRVSGRTLFRRRLLSFDGLPVTTSGGMTIPVDAAFSTDDPRDALVVVAAFNVPVHAKRPLLAALRRVARRGIEIGGVESGSLVLAMAGLLNGRRATTHWEDLDEFAAKFPEIDVRADRYVIDAGRFTTGGASPAFDMMLHLIRARHGQALALDVASLFIYDELRSAGDPQPMVSLGRLDSNEPRVAAAIRIMEQRIERPLAIPRLARDAGIGPRMLEALFMRSFGMSPRRYYGALRMNAGRRLVLESRKSMTEIAAQTGFASASAFARSFRARFGESPRDARRRRGSFASAV